MVYDLWSGKMSIERGICCGIVLGLFMRPQFSAIGCGLLCRVYLGMWVANVAGGGEWRVVGLYILGFRVRVVCEWGANVTVVLGGFYWRRG